MNINTKEIVCENMVRRILLFLFFMSTLPILVHPQNQKNNHKFILTGKVTGPDAAGVIYLTYLDENYRSVRDTTYVQNGRFSFAGFIAEPHAAVLRRNPDPNSDDNKKIAIFYLEAKDVQVILASNDFTHAKIIGSSTQHEWDILKNKQDIIAKTFDSLRQEDSKVSGTFMKEKEDLLSDRINTYKGAMKKSEIEFIAAHRKSFLSPYLLRRYLQELSLDSAKLLYKNLDSTIKNSKIGTLVYTQIQGRLLTETNGTAPDFTRQDLEAKELKLSSFKEKSYVLLDFWASWCIPCRQDHPHLRKLYSMYYLRGLNIIAISIDKDKNAWKAAISKDSIAYWYHVLDAANTKPNVAWETKDFISDQYTVTPIPVLILVDMNGKIIGRFEGTQDVAALDKKLSELFR